MTPLTSTLLALSFLPLLLFAAPTRAADPAPTPNYFVYIGTFSANQSKGIYLYKLDSSTATLTPQGLAAPESDPNFLALAPNAKTLYAVASKPGNQGALDAFSIDPPTGKLTLLNQQPTGGANSVYVSIDPSGKTALVANYDGPSIASFPINPNGSLAAATTLKHEGSGPNQGRQKRAFPHSIITDPAGRFAFSPDLGSDKIFTYKLDPAKAALTPTDPPGFITPPGSGPRHMAFSPTANFAYITTEMAAEILTCSFDPATSTLKQIDITSLRPAGNNAYASGAEIKVHPSGKFLYASVRGTNTIASFSINPTTGKLTPIDFTPARVKTPRGFNLDPTGAFLLAAGQDSNSLSLFRINPTTGSLTPAGETLQTPCPVSVLFVPITK